MKRLGLLACVSVIALGLTACGGGRRGTDRDDSILVQQRPDGTAVAVRPGRDPNGAYIQATELKAKGDCTNAVLLLRPVAKLGPGYETAQTALGECLLEKPDLEKSEERDEGLTWLKRAADAGWPEAQAMLALYFGAVAPAHDGAEAAYWLALYDTNRGKARVGFRPPDAKSLGAVRAGLSNAEKAAGAKRAKSWQRKVWLPPNDSDGPGLRPEARERGIFRGPPPL